MEGIRISRNSGSALVTVIVSMLFIGIIAAIVLSIAFGNLDSIGTGKKASKSFYQAETSIDELKTALQVNTDRAVEQAYQEWLREYSYSSTSKDFFDYFADILIDDLKKYFYVVDKTHPENSENPNDESITKEDYFNLLYNPSGIKRVDNGIKPTIYKQDDKITITNISLQYTDADGNTSTITTDLVISLKDIELKVDVSAGVSTDIAEFALIADQTVTNVSTDNYKGVGISKPSINNGDNITIVGSIYGGGKNAKTGLYDANGIELSGKTLRLYSDKILSRSIFNISNKATLNIMPSESYGLAGLSVPDVASVIYVKNVLINTTPEYEATLTESSLGSNVQMQAKCYVADDLTIDEKKATLRMLEGSEYYGYSRDANESDNSSSIVVNGKDVVLDFQKANKLWLAGTSFVRVPELWGDPNGTSARFLQGESITYRSLQSSYMLPGECIVGVGHNPISEDEYLKVMDNTNTDYYIDITLSKGIDNTGIDLTPYVNRTTPYRSSFVKFSSESDSKKMYYFYLNFNTTKDASDYFKVYSTLHKLDGLIDNKLKLFGSGQLLFDRSSYDASTKMLNPNKVFHTGNIIYYDGTTGEYEIYYANATDPASKEQIDHEHDRYKGYYENLVATLNARKSGGGVGGDLTAYISDITNKVTGKGIHKAEALTEKISETEFSPMKFVPEGVTVSEGRNAWMIVSDGDIELWPNGGENGKARVVYKNSGEPYDTIDPGLRESGAPNTGAAGIVLVNGDVYIKSGMDFWGTIIATGNIYLEGTGSSSIPTVRAAARSVKYALQTNITVHDYFSTETISEKTNEKSNSLGHVSIDYSNWKKD